MGISGCLLGTLAGVNQPSSCALVVRVRRGASEWRLGGPVERTHEEMRLGVDSEVADLIRHWSGGQRGNPRQERDRLEEELGDAAARAFEFEVKPEEIETDAPLFVEGLGLDSIDALELALAIHKEFGVRTSAEDEGNRERFFSIASLATFIRTETAAAEASAAEVPRPLPTVDASRRSRTDNPAFRSGCRLSNLHLSGASIRRRALGVGTAGRPRRLPNHHRSIPDPQRQQAK
jgi:acyl carrier protein